MKSLKDLTLDEFNLFVKGFMYGRNYGQLEYNCDLADTDKSKEATKIYNEIYNLLSDE